MSVGQSWRGKVERVVGAPIVEAERLRGGCVGDVFHLRCEDHQTMVAKVDLDQPSRLETEAYMLHFLAQHSPLPVPAVVGIDEGLLLLEFLPGQNHMSPEAELHAADLIAALHQQTHADFGFERDTLIGGLEQPNPWSDRWIPFFQEYRLLEMARQGMASGQLPRALSRRLHEFAAQLDRWLLEPDSPALVHGDIWSGNILADRDQVTGFLDPAIYYADPEIELAFITLFGTMGQRFFSRYQEQRTIQPGFFEERRDIYNLYPLLVHARLFGGGYVQEIDRILRRFGF